MLVRRVSSRTPARGPFSSRDTLLVYEDILTNASQGLTITEIELAIDLNRTTWSQRCREFSLSVIGL